MSAKATNGATVPAPAAAPAAGKLNPVSDAFNKAAGDEEAIASLLKTGGYLDEPGATKPAKAAPEAAAEEAEAEVEETEAEAETDEPETEETETEPAEAEVEETEAPAETDEGAEVIDGVTPEVQARIDKAMRRKHARMKTAEASAESERQAREAAEARVAELEAQQATPVAVSPENPLASVTNARELQAKASEAENLLEWVESNLDELDSDPEGVEAKLKAGKVELPDYTPAAMKRWLAGVRRNVDKTIRVHIPERRQFLADQAQMEGRIAQEFTFWKDPKSADFKDVNEVLKALPSLKSRPDHKFVATALMKGLRVIEQERAAAKAKAEAAKTAPARKPAPRLPGVRKAAPTPPDAKTAVSTAARKRFQETGSEKDLTSVIGALLD